MAFHCNNNSQENMLVIAFRFGAPVIVRVATASFNYVADPYREIPEARETSGEAGLIFKFTNGEPGRTGRGPLVRGLAGEFRDPLVKVDRLNDDGAMHTCVTSYSAREYHVFVPADVLSLISFS